MDGVSAVSAVCGIVSLSVTLLHGCFKGFALLYDASSYGRNVSTIRTMILVEQHKLHTWAQEAGLFEEHQDLRVNHQDFDMVPVILTQLDELLTDINALKVRYGL